MWKPMILWLTGLPGSGKTTLGEELYSRSVRVVAHIDADQFRKLWPAGYGPVERVDNVRRIQAVALWTAHEAYDNDIVVVSCIAPFRAMRLEFRGLCEKADVAYREVALYYDPVLHPRRPAEYSEGFTYHAPEGDEAITHLDTSRLTVQECVERIMDAT